MTLSEPQYIACLFFAFLIFFQLPYGQPRRLFLLLLSYAFYIKLSLAYSAVLFVVTALAFYGGLALRSQPASAREPLLFTLLLVLVLSPLIIFKYADFLLGIGGGLIGIIAPVHVPSLSLILPIGISFFTFAAVGYLIDVHLELIEPETRPTYFALFLAFFPLVTAGPIERAARLMPQFDFNKPFRSETGFSGLRMIFWGLVLKLIFADGLATEVNKFFSAPESAIALEDFLAMVHYMFYLYADFAGYSLIAIGSAKLFGLDVMQNFQQPFLSTTIAEFWRCWHISLSSWVRDYLFMPLQTHLRSYRSRGMAFALIISFTVLGLWHGAGWGFLVFGLLNGLWVTLSVFTLDRRNAFWKSQEFVPQEVVHVARVIVTFVVVCLVFVVFRAPSMHVAWGMYRKIFSGSFIKDVLDRVGGVLFDFVVPHSIQYFNDPWAWFLIVLLIISDVLVRKKLTLQKLPRMAEILIYIIGINVLLYTWLTGNVAAPFLYYKF